MPAHSKGADGACWRICYPILQLLWGQSGVSHASMQSKVSQRLKLRDDAEVTACSWCPLAPALACMGPSQASPLIAMGLHDAVQWEVVRGDPCHC